MSWQAASVVPARWDTPVLGTCDGRQGLGRLCGWQCLALGPPQYMLFRRAARLLLCVPCTAGSVLDGKADSEPPPHISPDQ